MLSTKQLRYLKSAENWNECLPLGNGFIGAMVNGNVTMDVVHLNEDSFWHGGFRDRNSRDAIKYIDELRDLILKEETDKAVELAILALSGIPESQRHYLPAGNLRIATKHANFENYERELDLENACAIIKYSCDGVNYKREYFINNPDNVMVIHFSADKENSINTIIDFDKIRYVDELKTENNNSIYRRVYSGGEGGVTLQTIAKASSSDGVVKTIGQSIVIENASEATLYLSLATTFRHDDVKSYCEEVINTASEKTYTKLFAEHVKDYQSLFLALEFKLKHDNQKATTTEMLTDVQADCSANALTETYFNFGRYLLIACSREGSLPATLQGIWNNLDLPPWDSKYTININTEMNYWPAELLNLSACHMPLFDHLKRMEPNGQHTAKIMYNLEGFCTHHNTDIWGDTAPQDRTATATVWVFGAAWLCTHIADRFDFTKDIEFAKEHYYLMKEACKFILNYQLLHEGQYITIPSSSPENSFITSKGVPSQLTYSCAMDTQIICTLFGGTIRIANAIGGDAEFVKTLEERMSKMPKPVNIGSDGRIMEWIKEYKEKDMGHRHISHLFSLFPSNLVGDNEEYLAAARKTIETRLANGGGHTGWSQSWIINFWARLRDGDKMFSSFVTLMNKSTYPNMFDSHPPFQIDGNFGSIAGIGEALVQSHNDYIELLPALPTAWAEGSIKGVCARGKFEVSITWADGKLVSAEILSKNDVAKEITVRYKDTYQKLIIESNSTATFAV